MLHLYQSQVHLCIMLVLYKEKGFNWLGASIKNIETIEERSAYGLYKTAGVIIEGINANSIIGKSQLVAGDVIVKSEGHEIANIKALMEVFQENKWKGNLDIVIYRNQAEYKVTVKTK